MPSLAETQKIFWRLIAAPEGVRQGLADLSEAERRSLADGLKGLIRGDERLSPVERLDVYANMYFFRLLDVLKEDFPAVAAVVGDVSFHNLVTSYLIDHPSTHYSVRYVGRHLPAFLVRHELSRERRWVADLARLEWAILEAFDGPDAKAISPERLQELPPERWADARLRLSPTLAILRLDAPVHRVWEKVVAGEPVPGIDSDPTLLLLWRKELRVTHRPISTVEEAALEAVLAGEDFGGVCDAVAALESEDAAAGTAAQLLRTWFADGLIVGLEV